MATAPPAEPAPGRPLRVWPGVVAVALQWFIRFALPVAFPGAVAFAIFGGLLGGLAVLVWWLFFSRAPRADRWGALALLITGYFVSALFVHPSIAKGMMGMMLAVYSIPVLSLALVASAVATRHLSSLPRRAWMAAAIVVACAAWTLVRTGGITGDAQSDLAWRWAPTPEQRLLARSTPLPPSPPPPAPSLATAWPGFRGPGRDAIISGVTIGIDWSHSPPVELWRRPIGPAWSSFAVAQDLIYTQEQRGGEEIVACYRAATGQPVWRHADPARFWESNAGPGPRSTPTLSAGRLYTFGATGILNALNPADGAVLWSRNAAADTGVKTPEWGFASSPLVSGDLVIVAASGSLAAYDRSTGAPRWRNAAGRGGYSSPQLATIGGVNQILLLNGAGVVAVAPADGTLLWQYKWPGDGIVQPALTPEGDLLLGTGSGIGASSGIHRLGVEHGPQGWTTHARWTSAGLKPYFNDFVVHSGRAYGFDGSILACIDLAGGRRLWKGGRYGHGQLLLLRDQSLLLVLSESGELALVSASPTQFTELARVPALDGKTWNHPVLADGRLLVRNGEEMVAFRLPPPAR